MKLVTLILIAALSAFHSMAADDWKGRTENPSYIHRAIKQVTDVMVYDIYSPPVSSRIYAYISIAGYEAAVAGSPANQSISMQLNGMKPAPLPTAGAAYSYTIAAVHAILSVGKTMVISEERINAFYKTIMAEFKSSGIPAEVYDNSIAFGQSIAKHILDWASKDNYKETRALSRYAISTDDYSWKPTPPAYMKAVEPHWSKIRTFLLDSAQQFKPAAPTKFSAEKTSIFYKEAKAVRDIGSKLTTEQKNIAAFWDCNPFKMNVNGHVMYASKKISPGGHWINIAALACQKNSADVMQSLEVYACLAITIADAFISCWDEKYRSVVIRPETYINRYIDGAWQPFLQTPPFPEYTSGHSVVSSASAVMLEKIFGNNFSFADSTELEFGIPVRNFTSFTQAAEEAAISRFYGGIHYMPAIVNGYDEGKAIGIYITRKLKTSASSKKENYINNRAPLRPNPYIELPLGAIRAEGWLKEMLVRQKTGATGNLDKLYPLVMNDRNGWLGGDGDQWERGPYWIDGLLPLAYILDDKELIAKSNRWVEWALNSQQPDGYFGPSKDYAPEPGIQRDNSRDWWPKMVMLKILKQYYAATQDQRVIKFMTNYFRYQLKELPAKPLDHWTFWARYRGPDNLMVVYWLYNITGDAFLLQLAELIHKQTFDYTNNFLDTDLLSRINSIHCVNLAQGLKGPLIYYQQHPDKKYVDATDKGFKDIRKYNGLVHGLYGGDEGLHGNNPTQGSEFCSAVELMFSLESILPITGNTAHADHLERIAFNALPTQATDDFVNRQYFQQANQVMATRHRRNFDTDHSGTDVCFGLLTGYACCTSNMHQGWPKFVQNLWYATNDHGIAALVYGPSEAKMLVANGTSITIKEETNYPFEETIRFTISFDKNEQAAFPFHLRIPQWCAGGASIKINGVEQSQYKGGQIVKLNRTWKSGDKVELYLSMHVFKSNWVENSISVERGPLVYALKMKEEWTEVKNDKDPIEFGATYFEVRSKTAWNYALPSVNNDRMQETFRVSKTNAPLNSYPWNLQNAPIAIKVKGIRVPWWGLYNEMAGPIPFSTVYNLPKELEQEEITLIPYGCTTLRIAQFPVHNRR